jgi:hypothetical protein
MRWTPLPRSLPALVCGLLLASPAGFVGDVSAQEADAGADLGRSRDVRREANVEGVGSQKLIDEISTETEALFSRYTNALRQLESIGVYNRQMADLVASQDLEIVSLAGQLDRIDVVGRSVTPLMLRMIAALEAFVELDVPFLEKERAERLAGLHELMARADVTNAEKYRRIMEAYQIENEYGRTIEAYRGTIDRGDREITVYFLRFGRIALVYQTLDEAEAGVWNAETQSWDPLDSSYRTPMRQAIRIARKQAAPDLIELPLPAPKNAESTSTSTSTSGRGSGRASTRAGGEG